MVFICTCSQDATVDILSPLLGDVFRFNIDKRQDYSWDFSKENFKLTNLKTREKIDSTSFSSFYLRKPLYLDAIDVPREGCLENWCREEVNALFEDFYGLCEARGQTVLVNCRSQRCGKLQQLLLAERYFKVANWHFCIGELPTETKNGHWVAKGITGTPIGKNKAFFVKEVVTSSLDMSYPWFLQEKIIGEEEVTVVYVDGEIFAYSYPRVSIKDCDDVRKATLEDSARWEPCLLGDDDRSAICAFIKEAGYRFGRFDFIRKDGELWFLELNSNGQWIWLDMETKNGLVSSVAKVILREDSAHRF